MAMLERVFWFAQLNQRPQPGRPAFITDCSSRLEVLNRETRRAPAVHRAAGAQLRDSLSWFQTVE